MYLETTVLQYFTDSRAKDVFSRTSVGTLKFLILLFSILIFPFLWITKKPIKIVRWEADP